MKKVSVHKMKVFGYHGCLPEEAIIGTDYLIDIEVEYDFDLAAKTDNLNDTVDYVRIAKLVKTEMAIRAKLIENVAKRIHLKIKENYPQSGIVSVKLTKLNPPAEAELECVSVTIAE